MNDLEGIFPALYAAYKNDKVDYDRTQKLAEYYLNTGVQGLYICGSSGEALLQNEKERKKTAQAVIEAVGKKLKIIVHVGASSTSESVALAKHAQKYQAHAVSAIPSIYYQMSPQAVKEHWIKIIKSTKLPFIIYHIPQTTGFNLSTQLFEEMIKIKEVAGIKYSAIELTKLHEFVNIAQKIKPDAVFYSGADEQLIAGLCMGANGGIGGTYGVMPELFVSLFNLFKQNKIRKAQELQSKINSFIYSLISTGSLFDAAKYILSLRGLQVGSARAPLLQITNKQKPKLEELNEEIIKTTKLFKNIN